MGKSFFLCGYSGVLNSTSFRCVVSLACRAYRLFVLYVGVFSLPFSSLPPIKSVGTSETSTVVKPLF